MASHPAQKRAPRSRHPSTAAHPAPKHPTQLELKLPSGHGGRRPGAGRPRTSEFQSHVARPEFSARHPLHVTLRLREGLPSFRRKESFRALRASVVSARARGLAIVHFAILSNHVHLILEAPSKAKLARQLQGFTISLGKSINRVAGRKGPVFVERYHLHVLKAPSEVRNALRYVLTNEDSHEQRKRAAGAGANTGPGSKRAPRVKFDPYSSASAFEAWGALFPREKVRFEDTSWSEATVSAWAEEMLSEPKTWLLKQGWRAKV